MPSINAHTHRLGLGTVQFGLDYGIVNTNGQVSTRLAHEIMLEASRSGVTLLDTASLYGSSEQVIGELLEVHPADTFRVVTKTLKWDLAASLQENLARIDGHIDQSLERLHVDTLGGLLLHDADDLLDDRGGSALWALLEARRARGQVVRIGYSLYDPSQLDRLVDLGYHPDLIQIPANAFDQRFVAHPAFEALDHGRTEVHVRSCFLQGSLLHPAGELPENFGPLREHVTRWHAFLRHHGLTALQGALAYELSNPRFDRIIVGVQTLEQWAEIIDTVRHLDLDSSIPWHKCALRDARWVDPSKWPPRS